MTKDEFVKTSAEQGYDQAFNALLTDIAEQDAEELVEQAEAAEYEEDFVKAAELLAEKGNADAQFFLGCIYYKGRGVKQDIAKATEWYRKAAEQGHYPAQNNLGFAYDEGEGVQQDYAKAIELYRKSAEKGYPPAQNNLGYMYQHGRGVEQDLALAKEWYTKAAEQDFEPAKEHLAEHKEMRNEE